MFTTMQIRLERAGHCQKCEYYIRSTKQCRQCGCLVNLKVMLANESCPIEKWKQAEPGNDLMSTVLGKVQKVFGPKK
jgi:hypothetical protein